MSQPESAVAPWATILELQRITSRWRVALFGGTTIK